MRRVIASTMPPPARRSAGQPRIRRRYLRYRIHAGAGGGSALRYSLASRAKPFRNAGRSRTEYGAATRNAARPAATVLSPQTKRDGIAGTVIQQATSGITRARAPL